MKTNAQQPAFEGELLELLKKYQELLSKIPPGIFFERSPITNLTNGNGAGGSDSRYSAVTVTRPSSVFWREFFSRSY